MGIEYGNESVITRLIYEWLMWWMYEMLLEDFVCHPWNGARMNEFWWLDGLPVVMATTTQSVCRRIWNAFLRIGINVFWHELSSLHCICWIEVGWMYWTVFKIAQNSTFNGKCSNMNTSILSHQFMWNLSSGHWHVRSLSKGKTNPEEWCLALSI